ncbi:WecB/TagA/CpsF family glycosyltransferase [Anaerosinus massiliensis]|uniref:WecB/TagA/CpsF family glycosyltransferase n=1 Tax=Massilibacillus massiliensis TaxID=1806837 RepID=UPI000AEBDE73|nr:WecB/TagA/CpsF family glycosyltransferase [Massilibacillus massiliensis]
MLAKKVPVLNVMIDAVTMGEAVDILENYINEKKTHFVATANAEMIMMANDDHELLKILNKADLVVPDGAGTVWAARHHGYTMPERVAGYDLVQKLLKRAAKSKIKFFFLGSAPGIAEKAKKNAEEKYIGLQIVGTKDGYFSLEEEPALIQEIKSVKPDVLLVALGVPRQEKWIMKHLAELDVSVAIGVGGTLDVMAGVVKRAPLWMQRAKLEWLYRGLLQPKRIGRLMALPRFVFKVCALKKY